MSSTEIRQPPSDWITSICYSPLSTKNILAASSWDKKLRLYDTDSNTLVASTENSSPLLDCAFAGDSSKVLMCGIDKNVQLYDLHHNGTLTVGKHEQPVKTVRYHPQTKLIFSGGWDSTIRAWDSRTNQLVAKAQLIGKCHGLDISSNRLAAIDSYKRVYIYNLQNNIISGLQQPECRDNVLRYQMRCVRCFPNGTGFAVSSIEGRVAWEYFEQTPELNDAKFSFKCHRAKDNYGIETVYPVNSLCFHPQFGTFVTGGSDGCISVWDGQNRKRLWRLPPFQSSVTSSCFNAVGDQLSIAISSQEIENPNNSSSTPPQIIFRQVKEEDVRPKIKTE